MSDGEWGDGWPVDGDGVGGRYGDRERCGFRERYRFRNWFGFRDAAGGCMRTGVGADDFFNDTEWSGPSSGLVEDRELGNGGGL